MDLNILNNIKSIESNHILNILVLNNDFSFEINDLVSLKPFGNIYVAVSTTLQSSQLVGKLNGLNYKINLTTRIPIISYDLVISNYESDLLKLILRNLTIKYFYLVNKSTNFNIENYIEINKNVFKLKTVTTSSQNNLNNIESNLNVINNDKQDDTELNYDIFIKNINITPIKYDEYRINYLNPVVPGKVSIIMIVSSLNNTFAEVIRNLKAQDYPLIEFIIIDNGAGFRNNVKPNIRYGSKMNVKFCEYHAKELCSGEYMFILHEDAIIFDINDYIEQGKYETR